MQHFIRLKEQGRMSAEFEFLHKTNVKKWWSVEGVKLSEIRYLGFAKDITERKQAELILKERNNQIVNQNERYKQLNAELQKSKEKAEESDRLKTAFLQNMSHEIRTPLNAIMGFAMLLPGCFDDKEKLEKFSRIINERGADLIEIINGILDISKIESGQLTVNAEDIQLEKVFHEMESFFLEYQKRIRKQNIRFDIVLDSKIDNYSINTDPAKLKQILINLVGNAFKYTHTGNIEVGCSLKKDNELLFYVKDTGIGIPANRHADVFERFIQIHQDSNQLYGGNGLGLSIVKGLLELLEGKIWLESEVGIGSTFFFTLPLKRK
jgi:signal transduction histidine kinase